MLLIGGSLVGNRSIVGEGFSGFAVSIVAFSAMVAAVRAVATAESCPGLISLIVAMKAGKTVEAGIVGNEGAAGIPAIAGLLRSPLREVVQIGGNGFRVKAGDLQNILAVTPRLGHMLGRFVMVMGMQVAQTAACNRVHNIEQRLARWLLMAHVRIHSGRLPITHDFLATMLGTDRPSVTLAAGTLQKLTLIEYTRGVVKILDLKKLEQFACECFGVIQKYSIDFIQPSS